MTATGGKGEAAGIGNGENDANDAAVNISATTAMMAFAPAGEAFLCNSVERSGSAPSS